jgi:hypothetical protein
VVELPSPPRREILDSEEKINFKLESAEKIALINKIPGCRYFDYWRKSVKAKVYAKLAHLGLSAGSSPFAILLNISITAFCTVPRTKIYLVQLPGLTFLVLTKLHPYSCGGLNQQNASTAALDFLLAIQVRHSLSIQKFLVKIFFQ